MNIADIIVRLFFLVPFPIFISLQRSQTILHEEINSENVMMNFAEFVESIVDDGDVNRGHDKYNNDYDDDISQSGSEDDMKYIDENVPKTVSQVNRNVSNEQSDIKNPFDNDFYDGKK